MNDTVVMVNERYRFGLNERIYFQLLIDCMH